MPDDVKGETPAETPKQPEAGGTGAQTLKIEDVEKLVQSAADKVRTEYSQKFKAQEAVIDELRRSKMTEKEIREEKEKLLAQKEQEVRTKELTLYATDTLKQEGLDLSFREFVLAADEGQTKDRILSLKGVFQKAVEDAVQGKFKAAGHEPGASNVKPAGGVINYADIKGKDLRNLPPEELEKLKQAMASGLIRK